MLSFDPREEIPIPLNKARLLPMVAAGRDRPPDFKTILAWTRGGCRGVVLESLRIGGTICTSEQALLRFIDRLSTGTPKPRGKTAEQRRRDHDRASQYLAALGM